MVKPLDVSTFPEFVRNHPIAVVDFGADWCQPCQMLKPVVAELASLYDGKAAVAAVNVDQNHELAQQFQIAGVPTVIFFKNGERVADIVGVNDQAVYQSTLDSLLMTG